MQSVGDDGEIDAFAGVGRCLAEMVHGQALGWAPIDANSATDATALVDNHGGSVLTKFASGHLGQFDIVIDRVDSFGRDHLDALMWASVDAAVTENAAIAVNEDIELTLEAALGFFEPDRLGEANLNLKGRVQRAKSAIGNG